MWDCGGEVQMRLLSNPAVLIRRAPLRRNGRVYLDTAPATRDADGGHIERGERRRASASDDVVVSNKSHTPGHRRGRCARRERALPVDRVARAWQASARRRPTDRRTWNVETANRLLHFRREGTRRHGTGGLVIEHHRPFPVCVSARELGSLRCATAGLLGVCSGSLL